MRTRRSRRLAAGVVATAVALLLSACGVVADEPIQPGPLVVDGERIADAKLWAAAQEEGSITLYTALTEIREWAIIEEFTADTGIEVDVMRMAGGRLFERIQSENSAGLLAADVVRTTDKLIAERNRDAGVFQPYCPPGVEELPEELKDPDCKFWASQLPVYAIGYNNKLVSAEEAPKSWKDLLDPKWRGKLGLASIDTGGSTFARDMFLRQKYGIEYWEQLAAENPFITGSAGSVTQLNASGEFAVSMALPGNHSIAAEDGAPLEVVIPTDGVPAYGQWIGLTQQASHPNAGKVFLNWHLSMAGQTAVAEKAGDYPVIDGAPGPVYNGRKLPTREEAGLVIPETDPEFDKVRDDWINEWLGIFGYVPEED